MKTFSEKVGTCERFQSNKFGTSYFRQCDDYVAKPMANSAEPKVEELLKVASSLKSAITSGYGPSFQHTLISTQTGRLMITNNGSQILKTLNVDHPIGKFIVSCVSEHCSAYGDNSKTFVALISELLYRSSLISTDGAERDKSPLHFQMDADIFHVISETLPKLFSSMTKYCVKYKVCDRKELAGGMTGLINGTLNSHLLEYDCSHLSKLVTTWTLQWFSSFTNSKPLVKILNMLIDYNSVVVVENPGKPVSLSQILPGILVSRSFSNYDDSSLSLPDGKPLKVLIVNCQIESIDDGVLDQNVELEVSENTHPETLSKIIGYKRLRTNAFLNLVRQMDVNLIISSYSLSTLEKTQCSRFGIVAVHSVPEPEIEYICNALNIHPLCSTLELSDRNITEVTACQQVEFGSQSYVHMELDSEHLSVKPTCLVVCAPTDGMSQQVHRLVTNCLRTVRTALTPEDRKSVV